jgi:hypothetical protein
MANKYDHWSIYLPSHVGAAFLWLTTLQGEGDAGVARKELSELVVIGLIYGAKIKECAEQEGEKKQDSVNKEQMGVPCGVDKAEKVPSPNKP